MLKNSITREELQLHFHPESDALSNLLFAPMKNIVRALKHRSVERQGSVENFGSQMQRNVREKADKDAQEALHDVTNSNITAEDLYFGADDGDDFLAKCFKFTGSCLVHIPRVLRLFLHLR